MADLLGGSQHRGQAGDARSGSHPSSVAQTTSRHHRPIARTRSIERSVNVNARYCTAADVCRPDRRRRRTAGHNGQSLSTERSLSGAGAAPPSPADTELRASTVGGRPFCFTYTPEPCTPAPTPSTTQVSTAEAAPSDHRERSRRRRGCCGHGLEVCGRQRVQPSTGSKRPRRAPLRRSGLGSCVSRETSSDGRPGSIAARPSRSCPFRTYLDLWVSASSSDAVSPSVRIAGRAARGAGSRCRPTAAFTLPTSVSTDAEQGVSPQTSRMATVQQATSRRKAPSAARFPGTN